MPNSRVDFIDWLKAIGMLLIVVGHFFGEPFDQFTQPVYPKQLGVAFFVFVMGWGLASETRPHWQVVYNRLFPMYFWGIAITLLISFLSLSIIGSLKLTNFLPFLGGINVLANNFPSNPTTWFIGTYLHILLLWALLLRRLTMSVQLLIVVFLVEWVVRGLLIEGGYLYNAYMLTTNWLSILALGMFLSQQTDNPPHRLTVIIIASLWLLFLACWAGAMNSYFNFEHSFPIKTLSQPYGLISSLGLSFGVSLVYIINTLFAVVLFQHLRASALVRFFARNTIIVFIAHMPLYDVAEPIARLFVESGWGKRAIIVFIMFVGLSALSELLHRLIDTNKLKKSIWNKFHKVA